MEKEKSLKELLKERSDTAWEEFMPNLSVDCVVFGFDSSSLKILLLKMKDQDLWGLPGGYIRKDEDVKSAARRVLQQRTGAQDIYLQQFKVFSDLHRSHDFFAGYDQGLWNSGRFISIGFYALVDFRKVDPVPDEISQECSWKEMDAMPQLMMDHREIFEKALTVLRRQLNYKPIGLNLLPEEFTMGELQRLYEVILNKKLNRGNFYRKMTGYGILEKLDHPRKNGGAHKAPDLYRFDKDIYAQALKNGFKEGW